MTVATVDIGTNTALLLISEVTSGSLRELLRERRTVRLGEGLEKAGVVSEAALGRLRTALESYGDTIGSYPVARIIVTGTSASRDAGNKQALSDVVRESLGVELQILSGGDEALLAFRACVDTVGVPTTVVDIGGGSTELVHGQLLVGGPVIHDAVSYNIGSVRLTERYVNGQPIEAPTLEKMEAYIANVFSEASLYPVGTLLVGSGGTAATAAALIKGNDRPSDPASKLVVSKADVESLYLKVASLSFDDVYALNPQLMEGRADVLPTGLCILSGVMNRFGFDEIAVSFRGLRHAVALNVADETGSGTFDL